MIESRKNAARDREVAARHGGGVVTLAITEFPSRLRAVASSEVPDVLRVRGRLVEVPRVVAIVGARAARMTEVQQAHDIARDLAAAGVLIVSGGAVGVDAASHRGALAATGRTVAVLGCGLDVPYPEQNQDLFAAIVESGGAVMSQFELTAPPRSWHFVRRNRTMAAMSDAVLVIAASRRSGSLHTARAALDFGRLVAAVPGTPGCEALIASGAVPVREARDLERALDRAVDGTLAVPTIALPEASSAAGRVLRALGRERGRDADAIALATGLGVREVHRALTCLELDGLAILLPGRNYICSTLAHSQLAR